MYEFNVNHGKDDDFLHYELKSLRNIGNNTTGMDQGCDGFRSILVFETFWKRRMIFFPMN